MRASILFMVLAACGGGDDDGGGGGGEPEVVLMETVGPDGGQFDGDGIRVAFLPNAVSEALDFMVTAENATVSGYERFSPVFTFEPKDLALAETLVVEIQASEADGTFYWTAIGTDTYEVVYSLPHPDDEDFMVGNVEYFGRGFIGRPGQTGAMCGDGPACTGGDICIEGVCMPYETP